MEKRIKLTVRDLNLYYGENHALKDINIDISKNDQSNERPDR